MREELDALHLLLGVLTASDGSWWQTVTSHSWYTGNEVIGLPQSQEALKYGILLVNLYAFSKAMSSDLKDNKIKTSQNKLQVSNQNLLYQKSLKTMHCINNKQVQLPLFEFNLQMLWMILGPLVMMNCRTLCPNKLQFGHGMSGCSVCDAIPQTSSCWV